MVHRVEQTGIVLAAAVATVIGPFKLGDEIKSMIGHMEIANTGANALTAAKLQVRSSPNADFVDLVTDFTANTDILYALTDLAALASGAKAGYGINLLAVDAWQLVLTSTSGTVVSLFAQVKHR